MNLVYLEESLIFKHHILKYLALVQIESKYLEVLCASI